jgi:hypothetical protein
MRRIPVIQTMWPISILYDKKARDSHVIGMKNRIVVARTLLTFRSAA